MIEDNILTKKKFAMMVEDIVKQKRLSYLDAMLHICELRELDPGDLGKLMSPAIKDKLEAECINLKLIEGSSTNTLPV